jgi:hypothetical protein
MCSQRFISPPNALPTDAIAAPCCGVSHRRQIKRVPLNIGNDKGKVRGPRPPPPHTSPPPPPPALSHLPPQATVSYTVTCFPAADAAVSLPAVAAVANAASLPPDVIPPAPKPSAAPPAPPIPREQFLASVSHTKSDHSAADADAVPMTAPANPAPPALDSAALRPAAPIPKPVAPKSAVKLNDPQDRTDTSQYQLRQVDVSAQDLHNLQLDDIRSFDRDSLLRLSALLLSRQHASSSVASHSNSATELSLSSSNPSTEVARLQATVEILKVRPAAPPCAPTRSSSHIVLRAD